VNRIDFSAVLDPMVVFLMIGIGSLGIGIWRLIEELAPRRWPQVDGTIVTSRTVREHVGRGRFQYKPIIEYEYIYCGKLLRSSRRGAGNFSTGENLEAESICAQYPVGTSVKVFVNPMHPSKSALECNTTPISWFAMFLGGIITTAGLLASFHSK
jgi:hypothetical protein